MVRGSEVVGENLLLEHVFSGTEISVFGVKGKDTSTNLLGWVGWACAIGLIGVVN